MATERIVTVVPKPGIVWKIIFTLILLVPLVAGIILRQPQAAVQTKAALASVNGDLAHNTANQALISSDVAGWMVGIPAVLLILIWMGYGISYSKWVTASARLSGNILTLVMMAVGLMSFTALTGCGDYHEDKFEEVAPNETAFVIPLTGSPEEQESFKSLDYLKKAKVSAKRIPVPTVQHDTGRGPGQFTWIPTVKVIKVDRSPITREWTKDKGSGSSIKDQAIAVESSESIGFSAGISVTVSVREEDTPQFLYYYFNKKLEDVVDQNVRSYVQMILAREFGNKDLTACMKDKAAVFKQCFEETKSQFASQGITIEYLGSSEGLAFDNPKIQEAIDTKFVAENEILVAEQEAKSAIKRNAISVEKAKTDAEIRVANAKADALAAEEFVKAGDAMMIKAKIDIAKAQADAMRIAAEKWNGNVPANILPAGTNMMFGLDRPITATDTLPEIHRAAVAPTTQPMARVN